MESASCMTSEQQNSNLFLKSLAFIERTTAKISGICVTLMMIFTTLDVFLRYMFNSPIKGNYEFQEIMLVCVYTSLWIYCPNFYQMKTN